MSIDEMVRRKNSPADSVVRVTRRAPRRFGLSADHNSKDQARHERNVTQRPQFGHYSCRQPFRTRAREKPIRPRTWWRNSVRRRASLYAYGACDGWSSPGRIAATKRRISYEMNEPPIEARVRFVCRPPVTKRRRIFRAAHVTAVDAAQRNRRVVYIYRYRIRAPV